MLLKFEIELVNMSIGLIADFPGPTVALLTNIFFYNRTDDNKLLSFCLLVAGPSRGGGTRGNYPGARA